MPHQNANSIGAINPIQSRRTFIVTSDLYRHVELPSTDPTTLMTMNIATMSNIFSGQNTDGLNPNFEGDTLISACNQGEGCPNTYAYNPISNPTRMFFA